MSARPFYEMIYHAEGWTLADAFRPQPGWGTRRFTVPLAKLGEHDEADIVEAAGDTKHAPPRYRLTSVTLYPAEGEPRVIWSTPADPRIKGFVTPAPALPLPHQQPGETPDQPDEGQKT